MERCCIETGATEAKRIVLGDSRAGIRRHRQHHRPCRPGIDSGLIDKVRVRSFLGIGDF